MLTLPSAKVVDLSTDRAKYHALHLEPGTAPGLQAEHRHLHPLVDVIERQVDEGGVPRRGWTEHDYSFTGYTLADIRLASNWPECDKIALLDWARKADQQRLIETARRRLVEHQASLSIKKNSSPKHLFSLLQRQIAALALERASVAQWRATVGNMQKKGVREEEVLWSGLSAYLASKPADVVLNKAQLLAAIDFRAIHIELCTEQRWGADGGLCFKEVAQRMLHQVVYRAALKLDDSCHCILRYVDSTYNYRIGAVKTLAYGHSMALNKYWFVLDPYGRAIPNQQGAGLYYSGSEAAMAAAQQHAREFLGRLGGVSFHTRFDHLTLYGGHDYREWLVTLPDYQRIFFGAHHFDHNVLAHIRTTSREDCDGRKLLFIEEVQSDWHQSGRRYGYDTSVWGKVANAPFKKEWPALAVKLMLIRASQNGYDGIAWPRGEIQEIRYSKSLDAIKRHYDVDIPKALNRLGRPFHCAVESSWIETRDPWLNLERSRDKWRVTDGAGKFQTRAKYHSREEAMAVLARHCRSIDLEVPAFFINDALRWQIAEDGLPLFGETFAKKQR
jgi:hypothetical protein